MLVILAFGGSLAWCAGVGLGKRHFEFNWESHSYFIFGLVPSPTKNSHGLLVYDGFDAVLFGAGLLAMGLMLVIWGAGVGVAFLREGCALRVRLGRFLGFASLVGLLMAIVCFFPPWRLSSTPFIAVLALFCIVITALPATLRLRSARWLLPGLVIAALVTDLFSLGASIAILLGILASIVLLVHLILLFPRFERMLAAR